MKQQLLCFSLSQTQCVNECLVACNVNEIELNWKKKQKSSLAINKQMNKQTNMSKTNQIRMRTNSIETNKFLRVSSSTLFKHSSRCNHKFVCLLSLRRVSFDRQWKCTHVRAFQFKCSCFTCFDQAVQLSVRFAKNLPRWIGGIVRWNCILNRFMYDFVVDLFGWLNSLALLLRFLFLSFGKCQLIFCWASHHQPNVRQCVRLPMILMEFQNDWLQLKLVLFCFTLYFCFYFLLLLLSAQLNFDSLNQ